MYINHKYTYIELLDNVTFEDQHGYFYEEVGELLKAINKYKRAETDQNKFNIFDELVDVQIQLDILKIGYEVPPQVFSDITTLKIKKIKNYIRNIRRGQ